MPIWVANTNSFNHHGRSRSARQRRTGSSYFTPTTLTKAAIAVDGEMDSLDGSWTEDFQIGMLRDAEDVEDDFFGSTTRARAHFGSTTRARALCHLHTNMPDYEATMTEP